MNQELLIILALVTAIIILIILLINKSKKIKSLSENLEQESIIHIEKVNEYEGRLSTLNKEHLDEVANLSRRLEETEAKYQPLIDKDREIEKRQQDIDQLKLELAALNEKYQFGIQVHSNLEKEIDLYQDTLEIGSYGLYQPQYSFDLPEQYKLELELNYSLQKALISREAAVVCHTEWSVGGSKAEGRKMTKHYMKLMLYAFNGECDGLIAKVKWNNASKTEERIRNAYMSINRLGESHNIRITSEYLQLKLKELALTYEYELKKQEEKEEQRRIREQMREEERAQKEFEKAQKEAEDEEKRYQKALEKAQKELGLASKEEMEALNQKIGDLEKHLQEAKEKKERALSLAQQTKVGHIYVISNIGSFGEDVYKIGMTRRLDPLDRIKELGDASVPFQFDIHAIIYSENAPQLEYELHKRFNEKRLNRINGRKEFFKISLEEIETFIKGHSSAEIQFTKLAEAKEFRETLNLLERLKEPNDAIAEHKFPESLFG